jgi:hypothetical protein
MLYSGILTAFLALPFLANAFHNVTYNDNDPALVYRPAADWFVLSCSDAGILTYYVGLTGLRLAVYHGMTARSPVDLSQQFFLGSQARRTIHPQWGGFYYS